MAYYATKEMKALKGRFKSAFKTFKDDEFYIVEGSASGNGYHHSREDLIRRGKTDAYSIQHDLDKKGDAKAASAFDLLFRDSKELWLATKRLNDAARKKDPRVYMKVREFGGTLDGKKVTAYNITEQRAISFDNSHLWHLHVSVHRAYTQDEKVLQGIADVICGVPLKEEKPEEKPDLSGAPFKVGDQLEAAVPTTAYYDTNGKVRLGVDRGYRVTVKEVAKAGKKWMVRGATYWYYADDMQTYVAPEKRVINKYVVTASALNVRSTPSTVSAGNIVGTAKSGQKVSGYEVRTPARTWVVDAKGSYFAAEYLKQYATYRVNTATLNVRSGPGTSYSVVKQVKQNEYVLVATTKGDWAQDLDGNWYSLDYLKKA